MPTTQLWIIGFKVEFPALKDNLKVTKIIKVDPETLVETIIFSR